MFKVRRVCASRPHAFRAFACLCAVVPPQDKPNYIVGERLTYMRKDKKQEIDNTDPRRIGLW